MPHHKNPARIVTFVQPPRARVSDLNTDANTFCPSAPPKSGSTARSGCGINPQTLPRSLTIPATLFKLPFGLAASVTSPVGVQ